MTNDEILQAAKEAGLIPDSPYLMPYENQLRAIERFAAIIEKRTIERCAAVCEHQIDLHEEARATLKASEAINSGDEDRMLYALRHESNVRLYHSGIDKCVAAIRKLGEQ